MSSTSESEALTALASLLDEKGLTASDFLDAINAVANIKKREAETAEKKSQEPEKKIYQDKEFVYETRTDALSTETEEQSQEDAMPEYMTRKLREIMLNH